MKNEFSLNFWRHLTNFWGILTLLLFIFDFFSLHRFSSAVSSSAVIYGFVLTLYVGSKEFQRWQSKKGEYKSLHAGEVYPFIWTMVMVIFVIIAALQPSRYAIPTEFPATYITVLGIYIISQQSKLFRAKKWTNYFCRFAPKIIYIK